MNKSLLIALFLFPTLLIGQLATWNFDGQNTTATLSPAIASASAALVGVSAGTFVNTGDCSSAATDYVWQSTNWPASNSLNAGQYIEFSITAKTNATVTVEGISFSANRSGGNPSGPKQYQIGYSGNLYETSLGGGGNNSNCPNASISSNPIAVNLAGGSTITFRLFFFKADAGGDLFIDDVTITGSVLPVELSSFFGAAEENAIALNWRTATEIDNEKFIIERSTNERTFEPIGEIRGNGTTSAKKDYKFMDENPFPGLNYYRLKQIDFDGVFEYHKVIAVDFSGRTASNGNLGLTIAPNPVKDQLRVNWKAAKRSKAANIQLFDIMGRQISTHPLTDADGTFELPAANLPSGIYILRITQDGLSKSIRFKKG